MRVNLVLNFFARTILVLILTLVFVYFENTSSKASINCDIYTETDLVNAFGDHSTSGSINSCTTITLKNNITLTSNWTSVGQIAISYFTGTIEGNGFTITGLIADRGLIAAADTATIRNLKIRSCTVSNASANIVGGLISYATDRTQIINSSTDCTVTGNSQAGGLVAKIDGSSTIDNSFASGSITCENYCGGLFGYAELSTIQNSYATGAVSAKYGAGGLGGDISGSSLFRTYATGNVTEINSPPTVVQNMAGLVGGAGVNGTTVSSVSQSYATGNVSAPNGNYVAGLIGRVTGLNASNLMTLQNTFATGNVTGKWQVGSLLGEATAMNIINSYATGAISHSGGAAGGLLGQSGGNLNISNTYWNSTANPSYLPGAFGEAKTSDELKTISTFSTWSIENICNIKTDSIWGICSSTNNAYPFLMFTLGGGSISDQVWVGSANISCPDANPWVNEKNEIAQNIKPLTKAEDNLLGKFILEDKLIKLGKDGIFFDAESTFVDTTTYVLPDFGCSDRWLEYKLNKPIQFIVGEFTLQSNAQGFIKTPNGIWHDLSFITLYTDTAVFSHPMQFTQLGQYLLVITEQPDLSAGLIPTYGFKTVRFLVDIKN
jgi:hypothetical protein